MRSPHDIPLLMNWDARGADWLDSPDLPKPTNWQTRIAQRSMLIEATMEAGGAGRFLAYPRRKNAYAARSDRHFSYAGVVGNIDALAEAGLFRNQVAPNSPNARFRSRFNMTPEGLAQVAKLAGDGLSNLPILPREPVVYRDGDGLPVQVHESRQTRRREKQVAAINEILAGLDLRIYPDGCIRSGPLLVGADGYVINLAARTLYRVFRRGVNRGGRFYGGFWINAKREDRKTMTIDGEPVAEPDFPCIHIDLLYQLAGLKLDGDAYRIDGLEAIEPDPDKRRKLVKRAVNIALNAATATGAQRALVEHLDGPRRHDHSKIILRAISERHGAIARHFNSDIGARLQLLDSEMARRVVMDCASDGIPALSVHDSFLCPRKHEGRVLEAMARAKSTVLKEARKVC